MGHVELSVGTSGDRSLYQLESTWTTATVQPLRLGSWQGKVQVLAIVYTTCGAACPIIVSLLQRLEAALPAELRSTPARTCDLITWKNNVSPRAKLAR